MVLTIVRKILFLRHHVGHGSRLEGRELLFHKCLDALDDLSFGLTGQHHLRSFVGQRQDGADSGRIEADRTSNSRVPKNRELTIEWAHPPSLHNAYETVLALDS